MNVYCWLKFKERKFNKIRLGLKSCLELARQIIKSQHTQLIKPKAKAFLITLPKIRVNNDASLDLYLVNHQEYSNHIKTLFTLRFFMPFRRKLTFIVCCLSANLLLVPSSKSSLSVLVDLLLIDLRLSILASSCSCWPLIYLAIIFWLLSALLLDLSIIFAISSLVFIIACCLFLSTISFFMIKAPSFPPNFSAMDGFDIKVCNLFL